MQIHNIEDSSFGELWQEFRRISEQKSIGQGEMDMLNIIEAELLKRGRVADVAIKYEKSINKKVEAYFLIVPDSKFNQNTGEPDVSLLEFFKQKFEQMQSIKIAA